MSHERENYCLCLTLIGVSCSIFFSKSTQKYISSKEVTFLSRDAERNGAVS